METDRPGRKNPLTLMMSEVFDSLMRQMMFCLPGKVVNFDPETQLAQVECGIQRIVNGEPRTIAVIENVPVVFAGDSEFYFWHQITPGETEGIVQFSQRAMDTWLDQGGPAKPHEGRMLDESDAIFIPGCRSIPGAIPNFKNEGAGFGNYAGDTYVHLKSSGDGEVVTAGDLSAIVSGNASIDAAGEITATAGADITATASGNATITAAMTTINGPVQINGPLAVAGGITGTGGAGVSMAGTVTITGGDVTADGISLKAHTHNGDSGGTTGPPK